MLMFVTTLVFIFIIRLCFPSKVSIATSLLLLLSYLVWFFSCADLLHRFFLLPLLLLFYLLFFSSSRDASSVPPIPASPPAPPRSPASAEEGELSEDELEKKRALLMKELENTQLWEQLQLHRALILLHGALIFLHGALILLHGLAKFLSSKSFGSVLFFIFGSSAICLLQLNFTVVSRTTVSQDRLPVQLAIAKFLSKIKGNFWGSAVSMILALY